MGISERGTCGGIDAENNMKNPKILYVSCHSVLEYDELRMFRDLGWSFLSIGSYFDPNCDFTRPTLYGCSIVEDSKTEYHKMCHDNSITGLPPELHNKRFTKEFLDHFDIIIIMHIPVWIIDNWKVLKGRNVIWRTIGQSTPHVERSLKKCREEGLKIVRYSPKEWGIPDYIGEDVLIRFAKYKEDFKPWTGEIDNVITICQSLKQRGDFCNADLYSKVVEKMPSKLYGYGNPGGEVGCYNDLIDILSKNRVYFYVGTKPASYTLNFMEASMAGIPIVSIGRESARFEGHDYFEVAPLLEKYQSGLVSDDSEQLRKYIQTLLSDRILAEDTSHRLVIMAHELFDAEKIRIEWERFFDRL